MIVNRYSGPPGPSLRLWIATFIFELRINHVRCDMSNMGRGAVAVAVIATAWCLATGTAYAQMTLVMDDGSGLSA